MPAVASPAPAAPAPPAAAAPPPADPAPPVAVEMVCSSEENSGVSRGEQREGVGERTARRQRNMEQL